MCGETFWGIWFIGSFEAFQLSVLVLDLLDVLGPLDFPRRCELGEFHFNYTIAFS